jgi:hypothetical protein
MELVTLIIYLIISLFFSLYKMIDSYIPGLNKAAIQFVYKNLMMESSDDEAREQFTKFEYLK